MNNTCPVTGTINKNEPLEWNPENAAELIRRYFGDDLPTLKSALDIERGANNCILSNGD